MLPKFPLIFDFGDIFITKIMFAFSMTHRKSKQTYKIHDSDITEDDAKIYADAFRQYIDSLNPLEKFYEN